MRLIEERRGSNVVTYVYEPDSYVPLARIDAKGDTTDHGGLGTTDDAQINRPARHPREGGDPDRAAAPVSTDLGNKQRTSSPNGNVVSVEYEQHSRTAKLAQKPLFHREIPAGAGIPLNSPDSQHAANDDFTDWDALKSPRNRDAKQSANANAPLANVYYFHTDQVGLPEELSDQEGNIRWRAAYTTWGNTIAERWEAVNLAGEALEQRAEQPERDNQPLAVQQNLRFQGQYLDRDTGLHYNTFRFYDPDIGRFISPVNRPGYELTPRSWTDFKGYYEEVRHSV
jgi:RHS repeat-associated protein